MTFGNVDFLKEYISMTKKGGEVMPEQKERETAVLLKILSELQAIRTILEDRDVSVSFGCPQTENILENFCSKPNRERRTIP